MISPQGIPSVRLSITARCQLRCLYCVPDGYGCHEGGTGESLLSFEQQVRFIRTVRDVFGGVRVRITGGEPLIRKDLPRLGEMLAGEDPDDLALTTNGQLLEKQARILKKAGLRRLNVSLDSLRPETFSRMTRGGSLSSVLAGLRAAADVGLDPIKVNCVVIRSYNEDEVVSLADFAVKSGYVLRFLELMPLGFAAEGHDRWFVSSDETLEKLSTRYELKALPAQPGKTAREYLVRDETGREGRIGIISPVSRPFCEGCRRLRLTRSGQLISCLARGTGPDLAPLLRDDSRLKELAGVLCREMGAKTKASGFHSSHAMATVGG